MEWKKLLDVTKLKEEEPLPEVFDNYYISPFERDYERIVSSPAFRRLQDKTQVFPLAKNDFVRTRLTHSLEVSTIAKQLGIMCFSNTTQYQHSLIGLDEDVENEQTLLLNRTADILAILSCAGLLHDIGNPPFGHVGEAIIGEWFRNNLDSVLCSPGLDGQRSVCLNDQMRNDLFNFEGNAQALRILGKAQLGSELNLPISIIGTLIKYPTISTEVDPTVLIRKKVGCFASEKRILDLVVKKTGTIDENGKYIRHPLSYLLEAADDISYLTADLEDAVKTRLVSIKELIEYLDSCLKEEENNPTSGHNDNQIKRTREVIDRLRKISDEGRNPSITMSRWCNYLRMWLMYVSTYSFSKNYDDIMKGTYKYDLFYNNNHSLTVVLLRKAMGKFVFNSRDITEPELSAEAILNVLLDYIVPAVLRIDSEKTTRDKKILTIISKNHISDYREAILKDNNSDEEKVYRRILIAIDYISGMTDGYAKTMYRKLLGID